MGLLGVRPGKVVLRDRPVWQYKEIDPIAIPTSLRNPTPAVQILQGRADKLGLSPGCFRRALLITQALDNACVERGYSLKARGMNQYEWMNGPNYRDDPEYGGHVEIAIRDNTFVLALSQDPKAHSTVGRRTGKDAESKDSLQIRIVGRRARVFWRNDCSESRFGDGLEFLPRLVQELDLRAEAADDQRCKEEEEKLRLHHEWEAAKIRAREQFIQNRRLMLLHYELDRRNLTVELEAYLRELRARVATVDEQFR